MSFGILALVLLGPLVVSTDGVVVRALENAMAFRVDLPYIRGSLLGNRNSSRPSPSELFDVIQKAVHSAMKDPVCRRDFALAADGARIAPLLTSSFDTSDHVVARPPENILDEDLRSASYWSIPDNHGQVGIKVPAFIYPTNVTVDHVPKEIAADVRQAPRSMVLWGLLEGKGNQERYKGARDGFSLSRLRAVGDGPPITGGGTFLPLASFEYAIDAEFHVQTFAVDPSVISSRIYFGVFVLEMRSNWGSPTSRLYRVRIHGEEVSP